MGSDYREIERLVLTKKHLIKKIIDMEKQINIISFQIKDIESS